MILCGGRGYRLKEETEFIPKPMIQIGGQPVLWHILNIYSHYGFNDFVIALGYKGNVIKDYFANKKYYDGDFTLDTKTKKIRHLFKPAGGYKVTLVDTGLDSLTGERVRLIKKYIDTPNFMVTYGDGVSNININQLYKYHLHKKATATITGVYPYLRYGGMKIDANGFAYNFERKAQIRQTINGGFMVFSKKIFNYIKPNSMIEEVFTPLSKEKRVAVFEHKGFWQSMDTYQDMEELNALWDKTAPWKIW